MPVTLKGARPVVAILLAGALGCTTKRSVETTATPASATPQAQVASAAAKDFEVEFTGLSALLVSKEKKRATVLFPISREHPHEPLLIVYLGDLTSDGDVDQFPDKAGPFAWKKLAHQSEIEILPGGQTVDVNDLGFEGLETAAKECPKALPHNKNNLAWLVDLNTLTGKPSRSDLTQTTFPDNVSVRCFLRTGRLTVAGHAKEKKVVQRFGFEGGNWQGTRAIADTVSYTVESSNGRVELNVNAPGESNDLKKVSFDLPAKVLIVNSPITPARTDPDIAEHFNAFYGLLDRNPLDPKPKLQTGDVPCGKEDLPAGLYPPRKPCPQAVLSEPPQ